MPSPEALTRAAHRRDDVLQFIAQVIADTYFAPTVDELSTRFGFSRATLRTDLIALDRLGLIHRRPDLDRGVAITPDGHAYLAALTAPDPQETPR